MRDRIKKKKKKRIDQSKAKKEDQERGESQKEALVIMNIALGAELRTLRQTTLYCLYLTYPAAAMSTLPGHRH